MSVSQFNYANFQELAKEHSIVALACVRTMDHETAITIADRFIDEDYFFLLESASGGGGHMARYSFLGFDRLWSWKFQQAEAKCLLTDDDGEKPLAIVDDQPLFSLRDLMKAQSIGALYESATPLADQQMGATGSACGYFSYDFALAAEPSIGKLPKKAIGLPDSFFFVPKNYLVLDQLSRKLTIVRHLDTKAIANEDDFKKEIEKLNALVNLLEKPHLPPKLRTQNADIKFDNFHASFPKEKFLKAVETCLEQIRAGEIFQIQVGNRMSCETKARPFDIFRHLRCLNPSPYMFFYKIKEDHIIGASPEMMVNVSNGKVTHRPIAGTRKRTWNELKDATMRKELVECEKERAEHVMLVDLGRNDIGRVAAAGSVQVEELMVVEEYSHVFHMVSQVTGTLGEGQDAYTAMISGFPNGTVTGAPKIRAMQIINELEPISREFYAGSLGMFDFEGNLKSTILIRSMHYRDGKVCTQASAGIVYDSIADHEWNETRNKMRACLTAMQNTL